jgi:hypothetical protein
LRIEQLSKRISDAPRGVVLALVALTLLISPGYVRHAASGAGLEPTRDRGSLVPRKVAVLELACHDGVFTASCLRFAARIGDALEHHAGVTGPVRSLARERAVRAEDGKLRLDSLLPRPLEDEPALRALAASVRSDAARFRRFVAPGERATFVYADLDPAESASDWSALAASLRARFDRAPDLAVTARGVGAEEPARGALGLVALVLALAALALAPGSWRVASLASLGALAFAAFGHGLLGLLDERDRALVGFAPELLAASAFATSLALIARARAEQRRERDLRVSVAAALTAIGPALAVAALLCASGLAALFACSPTALDPRRLSVAAGMAAGLVAYPLGVALAGLLLWPHVLSSAPTDLSGWLGKRVERGVARPRVAALVAAAVVALAALSLALLRVDPNRVELHTVVLDAGARGAALEPAFLERVESFQRELERRPGVLWSSSFVDAVVAPANRALHDGDPVFETVPPTREDVVLALQPWQRGDRAGVGQQLDAERRRVAVELLMAPAVAASAGAPVRPIAGLLLALVGVAAIGGRLLRSARGAALCALPAAGSALVVLALSRFFAGGVGSAGAALAPLATGIGAALGLQLLVRTRALLTERAQLEIALSLALRESAPAIASAGLAGSALVALAGALSEAAPALIALACALPSLAAASALAILPPLVRATRGGFYSTRPVLHSRVSETQG